MSGLEIESLSWRYGKREALRDVSLAVAPGEFCGLLGPNGAGKTTLFSLATHLFHAREGRIVIDGADLAAEPGKALARLGVVFQQPTLDVDLTVAQNLTYFGALHGLSRRETEARAAEALDLLGLTGRRKEKVRELNGGHRRRMEIARALIHQPRVLLLDEPTVGLDVATRRAITDHVHGLCERLAVAVLWATHLVDEVRTSDPVVILHRGEVRARGLASDVVAGAGASDLATAFAALTAAPQPQAAQ